MAADAILRFVERRQRAGERREGRPLKILVAGHTGFISHAGRARLIADALRERGVAVTLAGDRKQPYFSVLGDSSAKHGPLLDRHHVMTFAQRHVSWRFYEAETLRAHVLAWRKLMLDAGTTFDAVVGDFVLPAIMAAETLGIGTITAQNILWTSVYRRRLTPPENHRITRWFSGAGLGWLLRGVSRLAGLTNFQYARYQRRWVQPIDHVRRELGLAARGSYFASTEGDLVLVADRGELWQRFGRPKDGRYVPVGTLIWEPDLAGSDADPEIQHAIDSGRPFVYASFGSSGTPELMQLLFDAFAQRRDNLLLILTTGRQFPDWPGWARVPANVLATPYYPGGRAIAAPSCLAVINHGGSGSAYQALQAAPGKPLIMIPTHADQQWNAEMLQECGLGTVFLPGGITPGQLKIEIDRQAGLGKTVP